MKTWMTTCICAALVCACAPAQEQTQPKKTAQKEEAAPPLADLLGTQFIDKDMNEKPVSVLDRDVVALYFTAGWCPPCRQFTPMLVEAYTQWKKDGKSVEVVLVSSDQSPRAMLNYMNSKHMEWSALPFESEKRQELAMKFGVMGIPSLVVLDRKGNLVSRDGVGDVYEWGVKSVDAWLEQAGKR